MFSAFFRIVEFASEFYGVSLSIRYCAGREIGDELHHQFRFRGELVDDGPHSTPNTTSPNVSNAAGSRRRKRENGQSHT